LRKFSAWRSSRVVQEILPSLVTPSTRKATSGENWVWISSTVAWVSSTQSWSSPAQTLGTSRRRSVMIDATESGWTTYGSPDLRVCPSWALAANA
jgi:hypothetical protein